MSSPLKIEKYLALNDMTKEELITLCVSLSDELGKLEVKRVDDIFKRAKGKRYKHIEEVVLKVSEVFFELIIKGPVTPAQIEVELNRRFPEKIWVYDDRDPPEDGQQGFYRALLEIRKILASVIKQQIDK